MSSLLSTIIYTILGSVMLVNGVLIHTDDIISEAKAVVNSANRHQLATVIELYYSDHDSYPNVTGGENLINLLESEGYIQSRPLDPNVFEYEPIKSAQDYTLKLVN